MTRPTKASSSQMSLLAARLIFWLLCLLFGTVIVLCFVPPKAQAAEPQASTRYVFGDPKSDAFAFQREVEERVARLDMPLAQPVPVAKFYSEPGESRRAFVKRITPEVRGWAGKNGFMACGTIATDGARYGLILMTVKSRFSCTANQHPMEMELTEYRVLTDANRPATVRVSAR